jgi:hypothetical protein
MSFFLKIAFAASIGVLLLATPALAKPAQCFTTDDGEYACEFKALDKAGSFTISAPGKPTFTLEIDQPGFAFGYADFGSGGSVALPGKFERSAEDGACWVNSDTGTKICAW